MYACMHAQSCLTLCLWPHGLACQALLSMGFSRQEHWSGLPFPSPGESSQLRDQTASLASPALAGKFFYHWCHLGRAERKPKIPLERINYFPSSPSPSNIVCICVLQKILKRYYGRTQNTAHLVLLLRG